MSRAMTMMLSPSTLAIASGDAKGNVVRLRSAMSDEPFDWLGLPGRLNVVDGAPSFRLDSA